MCDYYYYYYYYHRHHHHHHCHYWFIDIYQLKSSLFLRFNGHFPGGPRLTYLIGSQSEEKGKEEEEEKKEKDERED